MQDDVLLEEGLWRRIFEHRFPKKEAKKVDSMIWISYSPSIRFALPHGVEGS